MIPKSEPQQLQKMLSDFMKLKSILLVTIFTTSLLSGCYGEEEEEQRFVWPDNEEIVCTVPEASNLSCEYYLGGFNTPINSIKHPNLEEIWIADLTGEIYSWDGQNKVLRGNLSSLISNCHNEQGLLGFSFISSANSSEKILVSYTEKVSCDGEEGIASLLLSELNITDGIINLDSIKVLRIIEQPYRNHNGGSILSIGNNQFLWSVGDGGGSGDPEENGQNMSSHLGTIQYFQYTNGTIKPVLSSSGNESDYILHYGLRNPWKFDVDDLGRIWIADVGQYCYEEINQVNLFDRTNFGWSLREGMHNFDGNRDCNHPVTDPPEGITDPILQYKHENGHCSITGGYWMDWGPESMRNSYLFGDFCSGNIWLAKEIDNNWIIEDLTNVGTMIVGFGKGIDDELLIFSWAGTIYQLSDEE